MHTKDAIQFALTVSNGMEEQWMRSSSTKRMPPMLVRPLPWCLTSSDRGVCHGRGREFESRRTRHSF
jgi:hypothetical protein